MALQISSTESSIPFGIYRLDKDYIAYLKKYDNNVLDPDYTDRYCGPVLRVTSDRGTADYFVPIDPCYDNMDGIFMNFRNNILGGFMDFGRSLPCLEKHITRDDSDKKLLELCEYCRALMHDCAEYIFKKKQELENNT